MTLLVLGANTTLAQPKCQIKITSRHQIGQEIGLVWLPLDAHRQVVSSPAYLHETKDWAMPSSDHIWQIDLPQLFEQHHASFLQLIVYEYHDPNLALPAVELNDLLIQIVNNQIQYHFSTQERHIKASLVLEFYQRQGQFKCRALAENSEQNLSNFAKNLQISLDARHPSAHLHQSDYHLERRPRPQVGETWTGTAFAITPYHLLTCHHVIDGASLIGLRQQGHADIQAQVLINDEGSDSALLKVNQPLPSFLSLRETGCDLLGENVTTLGFPLTGLSSQLQVTQGNIAGLQGLGNDIRFLQFTAPIQPGSSGSPLLLPTGEVVGMVTHTISQAQNMNYAVKYQLLSALITSAGINLSDISAQNQPFPILSTPQLTKQSKDALWLVGCQA